MFSSAIQRLNDRRDAAGEASEDAGFTLIELMVVLLILAILLAIAIPTFLGVTKSANDRAAQSNLNTALVNAKSIFQQNSQSYNITVGTNTSYQTNLVQSLSSAEPNLSFSTTAVTSGASPSTVSVAVASDGNGVALAEQAKGTGNCWFIIDNASTEATAWVTTGTGSLPTAAGTWYGVSKAATTCNASAIPQPNGTTISYSPTAFPPS